MELDLDIDEAGRYVVRLREGDAIGTVTASHLPAAEELLAAIEDARDTGYGECVWEEQGGDYRWMLRRTGTTLTVVALWSAGTLTGWEHVFRAECELDWFAARLRAELGRYGLHPA